MRQGRRIGFALAASGVSVMAMLIGAPSALAATGSSVATVQTASVAAQGLAPMRREDYGRGYRDGMREARRDCRPHHGNRISRSDRDYERGFRDGYNDGLDRFCRWHHRR
jgi:hypothetical protein